MYSVNFTETRKKICLSLHYNRDNSYLLLNGTEIIKFKAKDSEIVTNPLRRLFRDQYEKTLDCMVLLLTLVLITE